MTDTRSDKPRESRAAFEKWLDEVMGLQAEWEPERNCYKEFAAHLAWKAWSATRSAGTRTTWAESVAFHTLLQGEGEAYEGPSSYGGALANEIEECFKVESNNAFCIRREQAESVIAALRTPRSATALPATCLGLGKCLRPECVTRCAIHGTQYIKDVAVPILEALHEPCKGCGKRPIDFLEGS